jgi:hypothetical protein
MAILSVNGLSATGSLGTGWTYDLVSFVTPAAGTQDYVWVEALNSGLVSQGPIQFVNLTATLYYNAVGTWSMLVPYSDMLWNMIQAGDFIININWRGLFSFGGKCEKPGYIDSIPGAAGGGGGTQAGPFIQLSGADYLALIANRIAYPNPAVAWGSQTAAGADAVSAMKLETAIKHYVNLNAGAGALAARRVSLLDIATDQARGNAVSYTVKFGSGVDLDLMDLIRSLINNSGSALGVSVVRNPATHRLTFDCYVPRNLSGKAWFSESLGNLTAINFSLSDPNVTDALVQGAGTNFVSRSASATTQWNKTETFIDNSTETDVNNLATTAQSALLTGAEGPVMTATVTDTPFLTFGRDYGLGDIVSIEVRSGAVYSDVVTAVTLTADPAQTPAISVLPTIGQSANATATDQKIIGQLTKRIKNLERAITLK